MLAVVVWQVSVAKRHTVMGVWQNVRCKKTNVKTEDARGDDHGNGKCLF